jgi:hypothetical protein
VKRILALLAVVIPVADFQMSLAHERRVNEQPPQGEDIERATRFGVLVMPSVIIAPSYRLEIVPTIGFGVWAGSGKDEDAAGNISNEWDYTSFGLGGGCGLFFRPVDGNVFRLSLGPDILVWHDNPDGDDNDSVGVTLGLRVNTDLRVTDRFFIRMSPRLVAVRYGFRRHNANDHTSTITFFDIATLWYPRLGFYFTF